MPAPGTWLVYAKMESVATHGTTGNIRCVTQTDDKVIDVGPLTLQRGYRLRGKIVLTDGMPIRNGMTVTVSSEETSDSQTISLPPSGRFDFTGLARGNYSVFASVKGYSPLKLAPVYFKGKDGRLMSYTPLWPTVSVRGDQDGFTLTLHPDRPPAASSSE